VLQNCPLLFVVGQNCPQFSYLKMLHKGCTKWYATWGGLRITTLYNKCLSCMQLFIQTWSQLRKKKK